MQSFIGNTQSNIKGHVRLSLKGDNSKFLLFIITSISDSTSGSNSYILNVNNVSFSDSDPFSINTNNDLLVSFAMVGTKGEKGDRGKTGADSVTPGPRGPAGPTGPISTTPGPRGPTGPISTIPGPRGPTGADSTVVGPRGPTGADSTVPGPRGPTGADSTVVGPRGPTGAASTVPGPRGPTGADSTIPGPRGPTGADSTVPGPRGPTGSDSTVPGPRGPTGADSTVPGPRGPTGADSTVPGPQGDNGFDANSFRWNFSNSNGNGGLAQFTDGMFAVKTGNTYTSNKYSLSQIWINRQDIDGSTVGTGLNATGPPTGWFSLWENGDILTVRNVNDNNDVAVYKIKNIDFVFNLSYSNWIQINVEGTDGFVLIGNTSFSPNATYSFSFAKKGPASTVAGPKGPTGADSTVPGPRGPTGAASTVAGPRGPTGAASTVAGPRGPTGPIGLPSLVPGPRGPTGPNGAASTVAGPRGPTGPRGSDSTVAGPRGPTGPNGAPSLVPGPRGPAGPTGAKGATGSAASLGLTDDLSCRSLRVGTSSSTPQSGEIRAANNVTAYYSSDSRLKENVKNIENPLKKIQSINGVTFDWTDKYIQEHGGEDGTYVRKNDIGVIAQEIQPVIPEIVTKRDDGYLAIKYDRLTPLLIEAIKSLNEKVEKLENTIKDLKNN